MSESRPLYTQDYNHNDIEQDAMPNRNPEAVRGNGRGIRRPQPSDSFMVDHRPVKRSRSIADKAHTADKDHIMTDEARTADNARTIDEAPTDDKNRITDEVLASIPLWMRSKVIRSYKYNKNQILQPIIEVYLDYYSDEDNHTDQAIDSGNDCARDINMLDTDDENEMEADEAMEEDNYESDSGISSLVE
ncbi:uncharacterized protein LOC112604101 isoform X2 [Melanaphis sacchari]|nr:uncharacterized protein LOC112604101 isoform X2 [Melanaphis sacchari]